MIGKVLCYGSFLKLAWRNSYLEFIFKKLGVPMYPQYVSVMIRSVKKYRTIGNNRLHYIHFPSCTIFTCLFLALKPKESFVSSLKWKLRARTLSKFKPNFSSR